MRYELLVGLRYTRAKRRNHFISFISLTSMLGIALGVAALIVVLSVMNGFQKEVRARILGVVAHVQITGGDNRLENWHDVAREASTDPAVVAAAPFVNATTTPARFSARIRDTTLSISRRERRRTYPRARRTGGAAGVRPFR